MVPNLPFTDYFPSRHAPPKKEATAGSRRSGPGLVTEHPGRGGATRSEDWTEAGEERRRGRARRGAKQEALEAHTASAL